MNNSDLARLVELRTNIDEAMKAVRQAFAEAKAILDDYDSGRMMAALTKLHERLEAVEAAVHAFYDEAEALGAPVDEIERETRQIRDQMNGIVSRQRQ